MLKSLESKAVQALITNANVDLAELTKTNKEFKEIKTYIGKVNHFNHDKYARKMHHKLEQILPIVADKKKDEVQKYMKRFLDYV